MLKQAIEINPDKINAYILLGNMLIDEKRYEEGIMIYKTASKISINDARISTFIANAYVMLENYDQAVKYYKKAMKQAPRDNEIKLIYLETINTYIEDKKKKE